MEDALSTSTRKTSSTVERAVRMVENAEVVALDLETTGLDPRGADIRLVQVSDGEQIYVIDLFKRDAGSLFEALGRDDLIVLAHGGDFEWRFVYHQFGVALENIVDTMLLSQLAFCGAMSEGVGLGAMAESELEVVLDKDRQKADWTLDPLPRRQLDYAAMPAFALMQYVGMPVDKEAWDMHAEEPRPSCVISRGACWTPTGCRRAHPCPKRGRFRAPTAWRCCARPAKLTRT